ncbi:MAG TPA: DUF488 family protein [Bacillota bacterium]|nr:DUF488 family protein [Bacillota bacterium]
MIKLKRAYDFYEESDGYRILVDRLWPRETSKAKGKIDEWIKEIAPSDLLRKWYSHDESKWLEFKRLYFEELQTNEILVRSIIEKQAGHTVTFVYAAKDETHNNAVALKEFIENRESKAI